MSQVVSIIDIVWKGTTLDVQKGASIKLGGIVNKTVTGGRKSHRAQDNEVTEVKAVVNFRKGDKIASLVDPTEGELQVVCDTGQTYTLPEAFLIGAPTLTGGEGKLDLTWNADAWEEIIG